MEAIRNILNRLATVEEVSGDYRDDKGFLICGNCHTPKEIDVPVDRSFRPSGIWRVATPCECREAKLKADKESEEKRKFLERMEVLRKDGISDQKYYQFTFAKDDLQNEKISTICKRYVAQWETMKADNMGILFSGTVGTGKSFLACCIANALIERLVPVSITNFPRMINRLQGLSGEDKQAFIDKLQRYHLLVIDDLGAERDTTYSAEQIFNVIDTRVRANKPTIITTNLTVSEMEKCTDIQYRRIYDRVLEMCPIKLVMTGESRRTKNAEGKREKALSLLWGDK